MTFIALKLVLSMWLPIPYHSSPICNTFTWSPKCHLSSMVVSGVGQQNVSSMECVYQEAHEELCCIDAHYPPEDEVGWLKSSEERNIP